MRPSRAEGFLTLFTMAVWAYIGSVYLIGAAALTLLPLPSKGAHAAYRTLVRAVQHAWLAAAAALLERHTRIVVDVDGVPPAGDDDYVVIVCNHHSRIDWMYLWCVAARRGWLPRLKIVLKDSLKRVPFFGWAMQAFLFVFVSRSDRKGDIGTLSTTLRYYAAIGERAHVLIFPEGTDLSPSNMRKSQAFAASRSLPRWSRVLRPRVGGFAASVRALRPRLDAVYDATISYQPHELDVAAGERPSEKSLLGGRFPQRVHVTLTRWDAKELPSDDAALGEWLAARWADKEVRLAVREEAEAAAAANVAGDGARPRGLYTAAMCGWSAATLLLVWGLASLPALRWCTLATCVLHAACTEFGGLGSIELALKQRARSD